MYQKLSIVFGSLILVLAFTNCTPSQVNLGTVNNLPAAKVLESLPSLQADGGNGQHYGGKIKPGKYVRELTTKFCGNDIKNLGVINVTENSASGVMVDPNTCESIEVSFDLDELDHAEYQQGRIGYLEGIYSERKDDSNIPGYDEVWCRKEGSSSVVGFDVVVKADYKKREFTSLVTSASPKSDGSIDVVNYAPQKLERRFEEGERLRYRASDFELEIRERDLVEGTGLMRGELSFSKNGIDVEEIRINCRLGGELDVHLKSTPQP